MSDDLKMPEAANRPSARRRIKPGLVAAALAGALLVPAAAVTIAAQPWQDDEVVAVAAGASEEVDRPTADEVDSALRECREELDAYGNGEMSLALVKKMAMCFELIESQDPDSPLTVEEVQKLLKQGLLAFETAGFKREQIPAILNMLNESRMVPMVAGERANELLGLMADSQVVEDYANGEIDVDEASKKVAETVVTVDAAFGK